MWCSAILHGNNGISTTQIQLLRIIVLRWLFCLWTATRSRHWFYLALYKNQIYSSLSQIVTIKLTVLKLFKRNTDLNLIFIILITSAEDNLQKSQSHQPMISSTSQKTKFTMLYRLLIQPRKLVLMVLVLQS